MSFFSKVYDVVMVPAERWLGPFRRTLPSGAEGLVLDLGAGTGPGARFRLLEHVRVERAFIGRMQDALTPFCKNVAGGCHLNRRTTETVANAGFEIGDEDRSVGGAVVLIDSRKPT